MKAVLRPKFKAGLGGKIKKLEFERPVSFCELPYPGRAPDIHFESVESLNSKTILPRLNIDCLAIKETHIFTDGSPIQGKVRPHAGTPGIERADDIARKAVLKKKTKANYDRFPFIYAKRVVMAASLEEWQKRYTEPSTLQGRPRPQRHPEDEHVKTGFRLRGAQ
ncbi:hypothetical protein EVAR_76127_1 [Eumeta japonica]|uniref:Uncharacterized protein n=1 Tax=Eumeta variegata TaxID=151549 RepID=A0A4C1UVX4_EUMVA|nr:hypothetical protein EVAR_76127_1 [Eumeta japonica]